MATAPNTLPNLESTQSFTGADRAPFQVTPLPGQKTGSTVGSKDDTNATKKARAAKVAKSKLKTKNRKRKKKNIVLEYNPSIESGTVYTTSGFSPLFDGRWLVILVTHDLKGKSGSTTTLELEKCITSY